MRFPDFYAAKREEVPSYIEAAYLQSHADTAAAEQERLRKQDRAANIQAVGGGLMNAAQMDLGEGKTPISMALRKFGGGGGGPSPSRTQGPVQSKATLQSPSYMASPQGQGMDIAGALRNPAGANWQMPGTRPSSAPPPAAAAAAPKPAAAPPDLLKGTGIDMNKVLGGGPLKSTAPPPPVVPANMGGKGAGFSIPTGPGPQAATNVPLDKMIAMQMAGKGSGVGANMTAQVGKGAGEAVSANIASKTAGDAIGKGLGGAFAQAGGAAVPGVGAAIGAIPAALRGDTKGAIKGGVGGAASSTLMAGAPAMAAAGPVGWAGMAGLAALSLYGMLG